MWAFPLATRFGKPKSNYVGPPENQNLHNQNNLGKLWAFAKINSLNI